MSLSTSNKLIILDRDGVINKDSDAFIKSLEEWIPIPGSIEAIISLSRAGYLVVIATNQSGVGRGLFAESELTNMHDHLCSLVKRGGGNIGGIFYCPHPPEANCNCRKPKAGLISAIENKFSINASDAWTVGDSIRDLEAGLQKNCRLALVRTGKGEKSIAALRNNHALFSKVHIFDDLQDFSRKLLAES